MSRDWVTVEGVRYVPEAPLKAEIGRLQHDIERHIAICGNLATENEKLRAALETIRMICANFPGGGRETITAIDYHARKALTKEGK